MRTVILSLLAALGALTSTATGAATPGKPELVTAAMVYNIARFSTWPPEADSSESFDVCLAHEGDLYEAFRTLEGRDVGGRPVRVRALDREVAEAPVCHVVVVEGAEDHLDPASMGQGTLSVGLEHDFLARGGAIRISLTGRKPGFAVNVPNAGRAGVTPSSKLLQLAEEVVR